MKKKQVQKNLNDRNDRNCAVTVKAKVVPIIITVEELEITTEKHEWQKTLNQHRLHEESVQYGGNILIPQLTKSMNKAIFDSEILAEWRNRAIISLFKKGKRTDPSNYKGITLLCYHQHYIQHLMKNNKNGITDTVFHS